MDTDPIRYSTSARHVDWAVLVGQAHRLHEPAFRAEAVAFARQLCVRARRNVERLVQGLSASGYVFRDPDLAHVPPRQNPLRWLADLESQGIHLPIFLQAWATEVGSVNLMGTHPTWPVSAYVGIGPAREDPWYTDPLVLEFDHQYVLYEYDEWRARVAEDGPLEAGPFQLPIAPDHIHKANVSGGLPYSVDTTSPAVDALLLNARDCTSIFCHVATAFRWGGFPGFAYIDGELPEPVATLSRGIEPL